MEELKLPSPEEATMEDFNLPSPERVALLERIQEAVGDLDITTPHFWAACQICDFGALEKISLLPTGIILAVDSQISQMVRHWGTSPRYQSLPSTPKTPTPQKSAAPNSGPSPSTLPPPSKRQQTLDSDPSPSTLPPPSKRQKTLDSPATLPRDANVKMRAEQRDNLSCVLTGIKMIEVAHIYPHHSIKQNAKDRIRLRYDFWNYLRMFWSEEKVTAWEAKLFPQGIREKGQEEVHNLISLAPTVHAIWGRGLFALKPISESDDKKTLTVQFFWQERQQVSFPRMSLTTTPISTQGLEQTAGVWLFDKNGKKIRSGDCFHLQTDDPIQKPLPSFELLEMQWFLHRIQGMAGAVDVDWDYWEHRVSYSDSDDDAFEEVPSLGCDEDVEDFSLLSEEPLPSPAKPSNHPDHPKHVTPEVVTGTSIATTQSQTERQADRQDLDVE